MKIRRIKNTAEKFRNQIAKMQTDNRGLTLIELIITVAIIAIFSGVVLTFITTGSNTYRSTSSSAKVQMETQELIDRMEDMIIDTNRSLYYANGTGRISDPQSKMISNRVAQETVTETKLSSSATNTKITTETPASTSAM